MKELQGLLRAREVEFDASDNRIMCFPHIINICCSHVIDAFSEIDFPSISASFEGYEEYITAISHNPIARARELVRVMRASGQRRKAFELVIEDGNQKNYFIDRASGKSVRVCQLQLLRDVKTRWDSVYFMLHRLRELRPVSFVKTTGIILSLTLT
jgi:hypothetical protein